MRLVRLGTYWLCSTMWKKYQNNVNKVFIGWPIKTYVINLIKSFITYPQTKIKQKFKNGSLEAKNKLFTYPQP